MLLLCGMKELPFSFIHAAAQEMAIFNTRRMSVRSEMTVLISWQVLMCDSLSEPSQLLSLAVFVVWCCFKVLHADEEDFLIAVSSAS